MALKDWKRDNYFTLPYYEKRVRGYKYAKYTIQFFGSHYINKKYYKWAVRIIIYDKEGNEKKMIEKGFGLMYYAEEFAKAYMRKH